MAFGLAFFSIFFAYILLVWSFIPDVIRRVSEIYPDPDGRGEWHAKLYYRWAAVSNVGYSITLFSFSWMYPYCNNRIWEHFGAFVVVGISIMAVSNIVMWLKLTPFRQPTIDTSALSGVIFITMFLILVIAWTYREFYFDHVAVVVIFAISRIISGLWISRRVQKIKKLKDDPPPTTPHP